jgi:hypothetical protein
MQHNTQQERTQPTNSNTHAHRGDYTAQHATRENTTHQLKHACASRGLCSTTQTGENTTHQLKHTCAPRGLRSTTHNRREHNPPTQTHMRIERTMQHNTQQERTQPTNSNTHAHREDLYIYFFFLWRYSPHLGLGLPP